MVVQEAEQTLRNIIVYAWDDTTQQWVLTAALYDRVRFSAAFLPKPLGGALSPGEEDLIRSLAIPLDVETRALRIAVSGEAFRTGIRELQVWGEPSTALTSRVPPMRESHGVALVDQPLATFMPSHLTSSARAVVPVPQHTQTRAGTCVLSAATWVITAPPELAAVGATLTADLSLEHPEIPLGPVGNTITLTLGPAPSGAPPTVADQAYTLDITPTTITITGPTPRAVFYGTQTLFNLLLASNDGALPCDRIEDWPDILLREVYGSQPPTPELLKALARFKIDQYKFADNNWNRGRLADLKAASVIRFIGLVPQVNYHAPVQGNAAHPEWTETDPDGSRPADSSRRNACPGRAEVWADFTARIAAVHELATAWVDVVMDEMGAAHYNSGARWNSDPTCTIEHLDDVGVLTAAEVAASGDSTAHLPTPGDLLLYTFRHIVEVVQGLAPPGTTPKKVMSGGTVLRDFRTSTGSMLGSIAAQPWGDQMGFWVWEGGGISTFGDDAQDRVPLLAMSIGGTWRDDDPVRPDASWASGSSLGIGFTSWDPTQVVIYAARVWSGARTPGTDLADAAGWQTYTDAKQFFADHVEFAPSYLSFQRIAATGADSTPLSLQAGRVLTTLPLGTAATPWLSTATADGFGARGPNYDLQALHDHTEATGTLTTPWGTHYAIDDGALQVWNRRHFQRYSPDGALLAGARPTSVTLPLAAPITAHGLLFLHALDERCQRQYNLKREQVGAYVLHYEDGSFESVTLKYAINIANFDGLNTWWDESPRGLSMPRARLAWVGQLGVPESPRHVFASLYELEWRNPFPEKRVRAIELRATTLPSGTAIACFGITTITLPTAPPASEPTVWSFKLRRSADLVDTSPRGQRLPVEDGHPGLPTTPAQADTWSNGWDSAWTWTPATGGAVQIALQPGFRPMLPRRPPGGTELVANVVEPWARIAHLMYDNPRGAFSAEVEAGVDISTAESTTLGLRIRLETPRRLAGLRLIGYYLDEEYGVNTDLLPQVLHLQVLTQRPGSARYWRAAWKVASAPEEEPVWWVDLGDQPVSTIVLLSQWGNHDRRGWAYVELYEMDGSTPTTPNVMLPASWSSHWGSRWVPEPGPIPATPPPRVASPTPLKVDGPVVLPQVGDTMGRQDAVILAGSVNVAPRRVRTKPELVNLGFSSDDRYGMYTSIRFPFPYDDVIGMRFPILWWARNPFLSMAVQWAGATWDLRQFVPTDSESLPRADLYPPRQWWRFELSVGTNLQGQPAVVVRVNGHEQIVGLPGVGAARLLGLVACMPATTSEGAVGAMGRIELLRVSTGAWQPA